MSGLSFSILWEWKADRAQKSKTWENLFPTYRTIEDAFIDSRIDVCQVVCQAVFLSKPYPTGLAIPEEERSYLETQPTMKGFRDGLKYPFHLGEGERDRKRKISPDMERWSYPPPNSTSTDQTNHMVTAPQGKRTP